MHSLTTQLKTLIEMVTGMVTIQTVTIQMNILMTLPNGKILIMTDMVIILTCSHSTQLKLPIAMVTDTETINQGPMQMLSLTTQPDGLIQIVTE